MHDKLEEIKNTLKNSLDIRYFEDNLSIVYYYLEFKHHEPSDRYLIVSDKYLNGEGFIITSFFTNKIMGIKWKTK